MGILGVLFFGFFCLVCSALGLQGKCSDRALLLENLCF